MAVFAAVSATFTNISIGTALARDQGILKRVRGTPLPPWIYMGGRIGSGVWIALISVVMMFVVGWVFFGFHMLWDDFGLAVLVFVVGMATFSALGLSVCAVVKNGDSVPAVAQRRVLADGFHLGYLHPARRRPTVARRPRRHLPPQTLRRAVRRCLRPDPFRAGSRMGEPGRHGCLVRARAGAHHPVFQLGPGRFEIGYETARTTSQDDHTLHKPPLPPLRKTPARPDGRLPFPPACRGDSRRSSPLRPPKRLPTYVTAT